MLLQRSSRLCLDESVLRCAPAEPTPRACTAAAAKLPRRLAPIFVCCPPRSSHNADAAATAYRLQLSWSRTQIAGARAGAVGSSSWGSNTIDLTWVVAQPTCLPGTRPARGCALG